MVALFGESYLSPVNNSDSDCNNTEALPEWLPVPLFPLKKWHFSLVPQKQNLDFREESFITRWGGGGGGYIFIWWAKHLTTPPPPKSLWKKILDPHQIYDENVRDAPPPAQPSPQTPLFLSCCFKWGVINIARYHIPKLYSDILSVAKLYSISAVEWWQLNTRESLVLYRSPECLGHVKISVYWGKEV